MTLKNQNSQHKGAVAGPMNGEMNPNSNMVLIDEMVPAQKQAVGAGGRRTSRQMLATAREQYELSKHQQDNVIATPPPDHSEDEEEEKQPEFIEGIDNLPYQESVYAFYQSDLVQLSSAFLIVMNFMFSAADSQMENGTYEIADLVFYYAELFFLVIFTVELLVNMYGSAYLKFWESSWNTFDFVVVLASMLSVALPDFPGVSVLRLFRTFRILRLFKRVVTLRIIIEGIVAALPGVANAFIVTTILMGIWGIMGVDFFREYKPDEFGTFMKSMYTMWKIMTLEGWTTMADDLIYVHNLPFATFYFISYTFLVGMVMTNVVVAILLERYLATTDEAFQATKSKSTKRKWPVDVDDALLAVSSGRYEEAEVICEKLCGATRRKSLKTATSRRESAPKIKAGTTQDMQVSAGNRFMATAPNLAVELFDNTLMGLPKTFPNGKQGWVSGGMIEVDVGGTTLWAEVEMNVTMVSGTNGALQSSESATTVI